MNVLDDLKNLRRCDPGRVLESVERFPEQCRQAWEEANRVRFPRAYRRCDRIVVVGMGGSGLPAHVISSLFGRSLRVPFELVQTYHLPPSVNDRTFVALSSYSGTTEEVLAALGEAHHRRAKLAVIAKGGSLGEYARWTGIPFYRIHDDVNPSGQPRLGLGYAIVGLLALLRHSGFVHVDPKHMKRAIRSTEALARRWSVRRKRSTNVPKQVASKFVGRSVMVVAAQHLAGNAHVLANQLNETAKTFAAYFIVPELNHHLLEGLKFPRSNRSRMAFLFLDSPRYESKIRTRLRLTRGIVEQQGIPALTFTPPGRNVLEEAFVGLLFGGFVSGYLALLNGVNPASIPWVEEFKRKLGRSR